jgi:hypothetical protein
MAAKSPPFGIMPSTIIQWKVFSLRQRHHAATPLAQIKGFGFLVILKSNAYSCTWIDI